MKTYKLKHPVKWTVDGQEKSVDVLEIQRPKGKHLKKIKIGNDGAVPLEQVLDLLGGITDYPTPFYDEMDAEDVMELAGIVADFLGGGQ